ASDVYQFLFFQRFEYASYHLSRTTNDATDLLTSDFDLHAVRMCHRVGLLAQLQQAASDSARHVEKCQITDFACDIAQALGHLPANGVHQLRILQAQFAELGVTDLGD